MFKNQTGDLKLKTTNKQGFTLVEIMIVVMIVGVLASIALPSFWKARDEAREIICANNRRLIEAGKDQYGIEFNVSRNRRIDVRAVNDYIKGMEGEGSVMACPSDGVIAYQVVDTPASCSIHAVSTRRVIQTGSGPLGRRQTGSGPLRRRR
jgi:prepilin-type N-terminal cleavage/methylation domain-containing protein